LSASGRSAVSGPISMSTMDTMLTEASPVIRVIVTNVSTWRSGPPNAHRRMIRNCGTAPAANAIVLATAAGVSPCSEKPSRTICVIVVAIADAAVYRVKLSRTRRALTRFMRPMSPYRNGMGQRLKPFSASTE
jgi:hypothetical protein